MKKFFTSLMLMLFAVLTVNAQANVFTSNVEFAAGEKSYLTDIIKINGEDYPCVKIGTSKAGGNVKAILPAGTKDFSFHAIGWSKSENTPFTVTGAGLNETLVAGTGNISGNSPYTFDVDGGYDPEAPFFTYTFETALAEETEVTFAADYRVVFYGVNVEVETPAAGWDGTVTTSFTGAVTKIEDLNNLTLTFPGASSVAILDEEDCQYMTLQNEDGSELYGVWGPTMGSEYTINGNSITLAGFMAIEGVTTAIPAGTTKLYVEDYGTLSIDGGEEQYLETMVFDANIAAAAEPFAITVSNYRVEGANNGRQEASEYGLSTGFQVAADPALYAGTAVATLSFNGEDQGEAAINAYGYPSAGGSIQFNAAPAATQGMFAGAGEYTLIVPEGVFVDAEGTPNAAFSSTWVIIENDATPFDIAGVTMNWMGESIAAGSEVPALSYMYAIDTDKELAAGEGHIEFFDAQGQGIGVGSLAGNYIRFMSFGETGYTTPGTYTLVIPAGAIVDAEGNPCNKFEASWTVVAGAEKTPFDIAGVTMNWKGEEIAAGSEVEALSYAYNVVTDKEGLVAGEGHIEFKNAEGAGIGVGSWNGYYLSFTNFGQDGYTTPGTYTLTIPAGALVDAEGNPCNEFTASWTVVAPETQEINIETVEVGTVDKNFDDITDTYYTATVKFQKPEGAAYAYVEGMQVSLNGETSNVMFMAPDYGNVELGAEEEVTLVFTDGMKAATNDPEFEGDLRQPGSYVATAEIYFMDENYLELPVVAKYTGSIVLPNLNPVELGEPVFSVDNDPYYGMISKGDLEVQGLTMTFPEAKNITPDMQIKVVATLQQYTVAEDEIDPGFTAPTFASVEGLENVEFYGDAMFGDAVVNMADFTAYIVENDPTAYMVTVSSIEVISGNGVEASWTANPEEGDVYGTTFEVKADEPAYEIFFDVEDGAEIDLAETKSINVNVGVTDLTGTDADLVIEGVLLGKDGTNDHISGWGDFEDGVDVPISRLTPGQSYQIVITKVAYGDVIDMDPETYMPIYENTFEDENGLATLNFSIKAEVPSIDATVKVDGTTLKVIFPEGTDLGDNYTEKPYILSGNETIEVADYYIDNTTGEFFDPLNLIVITLNETLADGEYTVVLPAGMFIVNGGENNTEWSYSFTIEGGVTTGINAVNASNNDVMFNIAGQRVNNAKGIVIVNGKKIVRK